MEFAAALATIASLVVTVAVLLYGDGLLVRGGTPAQSPQSSTAAPNRTSPSMESKPPFDVVTPDLGQRPNGSAAPARASDNIPDDDSIPNAKSADAGSWRHLWESWQEFGASRSAGQMWGWSAILSFCMILGGLVATYVSEGLMPIHQIGLLLLLLLWEITFWQSLSSPGAFFACVLTFISWLAGVLCRSWINRLTAGIGREGYKAE